MNTSHKLLLVLALTASLAACKKDEPVPPPVVDTPVATVPPVQAVPSVSISKVDLGNAVNADMTVAASMAAFKPTDTIFAAVATNGTAPGATLKAKWSYQDGSLVNESTAELKDLAGPAVTDFHISKPDGWPLGKYKVEVSIDGNPASTAEFTVAR